LPETLPAQSAHYIAALCLIKLPLCGYMRLLINAPIKPRVDLWGRCWRAVHSVARSLPVAPLGWQTVHPAQSLRPSRSQAWVRRADR